MQWLDIVYSIRTYIRDWSNVYKLSGIYKKAGNTQTCTSSQGSLTGTKPYKTVQLVMGIVFVNEQNILWTNKRWNNNFGSFIELKKTICFFKQTKKIKRIKNVQTKLKKDFEKLLFFNERKIFKQPLDTTIKTNDFFEKKLFIKR